MIVIDGTRTLSLFTTTESRAPFMLQEKICGAGRRHYPLLLAVAFVAIALASGNHVATAEPAAPAQVAAAVAAATGTNEDSVGTSETSPTAVVSSATTTVQPPSSAPVAAGITDAGTADPGTEPQAPATSQPAAEDEVHHKVSNVRTKRTYHGGAGVLETRFRISKTVSADVGRLFSRTHTILHTQILFSSLSLFRRYLRT